MEWKQLSSVQQLEEIKEASKTKPQIIFKHSTRCSISSTALNRMERNWQNATDNAYADIWYLDLIAKREISNAIATTFSVNHESPQLLLIENGGCNYHRSHFDIDYQEVMGMLKGN